MASNTSPEHLNAMSLEEEGVAATIAESSGSSHNSSAERNVPSLTGLPTELKQQICAYLDYNDQCNLRATCRTLCDSTTVATKMRLKSELSQVWTEIGGAFQFDYAVLHNPVESQRQERIAMQVVNHATSAGYSPTIARWLALPCHYRFPCAQCGHIRHKQTFGMATLRSSFLTNFPQPPPVPQTHAQFFDSLICGKCLASNTPGRYISLGEANWYSLVIKCTECKEIDRVEEDVSFRVKVSSFCERCYMMLNPEWYEYKNWIQETMQAIREIEDNVIVTDDRQRRPLPRCPLPPSTIEDLTTRPYHFMQNDRQQALEAEEALEAEGAEE